MDCHKLLSGLCQLRNSGVRAGLPRVASGGEIATGGRLLLGIRQKHDDTNPAGRGKGSPKTRVEEKRGIARSRGGVA